MALSTEQLALRRTGITATDAAAIVGLSPWRTPGDVWVEKKHPEVLDTIWPKSAQEARFEWGLRDEPTLAKKYTEVTGEQLIESCYVPLSVSGTIVNSNVAWMICTPDRLVVNKRKGLELKTSEAYGYDGEWGDSGTDHVPAHYLIQCCWSMMVLEYDEWALAARLGLYRFSIYNLFWNQELVDLVFAACHDFYMRCIIGKERPEFDWGEKVRAYVGQRVPATPGKELLVTADSHVAEILTELKTEKQALVTAGKNIENFRLLLMTQLGDISKARWPEEKISVSFAQPKKTTSSKLNHKDLCDALLARFAGTPEEKENLIKQYTIFRNNQRKLIILGLPRTVAEEDDEEG